MNNQVAGSRLQHFLTILLTHGVGLAYFLGSQKELGPALLRGEEVEGKPDSDLEDDLIHGTEMPSYILRGAEFSEAWLHRRWRVKVPGPLFSSGVAGCS